MKYIKITATIVFVAVLTIRPAFAQKSNPLADNAALRYWAAFSALQDAGITDQDAKELNAALETMGPLNFSKYQDLLQKNAPALDIMARGTLLSNCDWGLDYGLGEDIPVEYARKALALGRLNVLYAMQQYHTGNKDGAVRALAAGLRFAHDVGNGGSLFATLIAKDLLVTHLTATIDGVRMAQLSASQQTQLQNAVAGLGDGLDWPTAAKLDIATLRARYAKNPQNTANLNRIASSYGAFLKDQSKLSALTEAIKDAPQELASLIPNPERVLQQKQELADKIQQARGLLR